MCYCLKMNGNTCLPKCYKYNCCVKQNGIKQNLMHIKNFRM